MIHTRNMMSGPCQWDEHSAGATPQLKYRVSSLSGQIEPERQIFQMLVVMGMIKLWEHATCILA
jgi:hypothetical protein